MQFNTYVYLFSYNSTWYFCLKNRIYLVFRRSERSKYFTVTTQTSTELRKNLAAQNDIRFRHFNWSKFHRNPWYILREFKFSLTAETNLNFLQDVVDETFGDVATC